MKFKIFSIYDSKAEVFNTPIFLATEGQAIRIFDDMVNDEDKNADIAKHPEDYTLFTIGEFDANNGKLEPLNTPKSLGLAQEFIKQ